MKRLLSGHLLSLFLLMIPLIIFCSKEESSPDLIAEVGHEKISRNDFSISFALNPQYAIRTPMKKARKSQVNYLINQKYYLLAAREVDLAEDPVIQSRLDYIKNQEITKAYLHKNFINRIQLEDQEVLRAHARLSMDVHVRHLFAENRERADSLWQLLREGFTFEELARQIYRDSILSESGGDLGFVGFGDMDPKLEEQVYAMKAGQVSRPVPSAYGFHLLKVVEFRPNEQFQDASEPVRIQAVNEILRGRKADQEIRAHLKDLSEGQKIRVSNRILDVLVEETNTVMGDRYEEVSPFQPSIYTGDLNRIELRVEDIMDQILVQFGERQMRVEDFLERLKQMPPLHRPFLRTRARMTQAIIDMIRNDLILAEALKQGIQDDPDVRKSIRDNSEELLATEFRNKLYSENFKETFPEEWGNYSRIYDNIRTSTRTQIYEKNLFSDLPESDTVMAPEPIRIFLKNRYTW